MSLAIRMAKEAGPAMGGRVPMGDPGLLDFFKGIVKTGIGFATGGPAGAVQSILRRRRGQVTQGAGSPMDPMMDPSQAPSRADWKWTGRATGWVAGPGQGGGGVVDLIKGTIRHPTRWPTFGSQPPQTSALLSGNGVNGVACPSGYHANKSSYFLMNGEYVPAGSRCVKNRQRNPLNPKALSKSMGRLTSFKKAAKAASRITIRKKC